MQVEKMGFPTAPLVTIAFKDLAKSNAASRGMPLERICFLPHPMTNKSDEEMYKVLEGNDPITNKPLMPEMIAALTQPLTADEKKTGTISPDIGPPIYVGTQDELQRLYCDNNLTDFMPIILPTEEKVQAMLKGTSHKPDEVIGTLSAARGAQAFVVVHGQARGHQCGHGRRESGIPARDSRDLTPPASQRCSARRRPSPEW